VSLTAAGADPVVMPGELRILGAGQRVARAAAILVVAGFLAAAIIPVPIVHLVGIPIVLIVALLAVARQLRAAAYLAPMRIACPRCGAENSIGGGFGFTTTTGPIHRDCESCRRPLELRLAPVQETGSPANA
jgi:hypothetical protein